MMRIRSMVYTALCMLLTGVAFTACSDDDENWDDSGTKVELPRNRVFILNEGSYQMNNAGITLYDPIGKSKVADDIYDKQNDKSLGDTGQDIIEYDGNIYVTVYGSQYVARLNAAGVEQARYRFTDEQGQPRYMVAEDGKLYVTLYSGNVARLDAYTLAFEKMVAVGNNPEYIIEEDGKLYCLNSGWGKDNRLSIIDTRTFAQAEHVEVFTNPDQILEVGDSIIIQGYGPAYDYPVAVFNPRTKTYRQIGNGTKIAEYDDILYVVNSETDWSTRITTNTFYTYNPRTDVVSTTSFLKDAPAKLINTSVYMLSIDDESGDIYIGTSDYKTEGTIYRFNKDGKLVDRFESGGISPKKAVFLD